MVRRGVRRFMPALSVVALVALTLALPVGVSGCVSGKNCKDNDNPRVSANRVVYLYARNYIYAGDSSDRDDYLRHADRVVFDAYGVANRIFSADSINLQILPRPLDNVHLNDPILNVGRDGTIDPPEMVRIHQGFSNVIGVHWPEWLGHLGNSIAFAVNAPWPPCPSERCNWVEMLGQVRNLELGHTTIEKIGRDLASGFATYFNLDFSTDMANLTFNGSEGGTALTSQQRDTMWAAINTGYHTALLSTTCDLPIAKAPRTPKIKPVPAPPDTFTGKVTVVSRSG
jgi:hypothetical protein